MFCGWWQFAHFAALMPTPLEPALHVHRVRPRAIRLQRPLARGVAVEAARAQKDRRRLQEESTRARLVHGPWCRVVGKGKRPCEGSAGSSARAAALKRAPGPRAESEAAGSAGSSSTTIALATAGAIGGTPGSPTPPGFASLGTMCTSTSRHLVHPQHRVVVEVALLHAPVLERDLAVAARRVRPKTMPPSICASTVSGLTTCPQSIAHDHAMHLDTACLDTTPRPPARRSCRRTRGPRCRARGPAAAACPSRPSRRRARAPPVARVVRRAARGGTRTDPCPPPARSSSMKHLHDEGGVRVADRAPPQHRHADCRACAARRAGSGCAYGRVGRALDRGGVDAVLDHDRSNGVPAMIDCPTMRVAPGHGRAVGVEARRDRGARTSAGSSRRGCRPRASRPP